jgi:hypothetical protein
MTTKIRNPKRKYVRLSVELSSAQMSRLRKLAHDHGTSMGREFERLATQSMALRSQIGA